MHGLSPQASSIAGINMICDEASHNARDPNYPRASQPGKKERKHWIDKTGWAAIRHIPLDISFSSLTVSVGFLDVLLQRRCVPRVDERVLSYFSPRVESGYLLVPGGCSSEDSSDGMETADQIMYIGCWVALVLYILTTLAVFAQRSCIACSASFVFACLLWLDLTVFNAWFFVPAFIYHIREIDLRADSLAGVFRAILASEAAQDVFLMVLGSFGSWLAVFNAASMLSTEGCVAMSPHDHGKPARRAIKSVYRLRDYLGFGDDSPDILPIANTEHIKLEEKSPFFMNP
ncbi:hypothetical protein F5Y10DRAFT_292114 [Nemania abortiva]|nr:hypothetical protein F5Y10DRAFT_292114 [Nemania abortiva]